MAKLEDLTRGAWIRGILPDALANVVDVQWFGSEALELTYKTPAGKVANELVYRHDEPRLESLSRAVPGASTATARDSGSSLRRIASDSRISSTRCWRCTPRSSSRCRTRSLPSTTRC